MCRARWLWGIPPSSLQRPLSIHIAHFLGLLYTNHAQGFPFLSTKFQYLTHFLKITILKKTNFSKIYFHSFSKNRFRSFLATTMQALNKTLKKFSTKTGELFPSSRRSKISSSLAQTINTRQTALLASAGLPSAPSHVDHTTLKAKATDLNHGDTLDRTLHLSKIDFHVCMSKCARSLARGSLFSVYLSYGSERSVVTN